MYCVGLTGNIGSGKSTVLAGFEALGVETISADKIARELTQPNKPAFLAIKKHFSNQVVTPSGELNRNVLRQIIFSDASQRLWLENLMHPLIRNAIQTTITHLKGKYCLIEIPLLKNKNDYPYLNRILLVTVDINIQVQRIMARDFCDEAHALAIISTQARENPRENIADDYIINNGSLKKISKIIGQLHEKYLQFANK